MIINEKCMLHGKRNACGMSGECMGMSSLHNIYTTLRIGYLIMKCTCLIHSIYILQTCLIHAKY